MTTMTSDFYSIAHITVRGVCVVWMLASYLSSFVGHKFVLKKETGKEKEESNSLSVDKSMLQNMSCCQHICRQAETVATKGMKCYL